MFKKKQKKKPYYITFRWMKEAPPTEEGGEGTMVSGHSGLVFDSNGVGSDDIQKIADAIAQNRQFKSIFIDGIFPLDN